MRTEVGDMIIAGLDLYRDNGELVGTIYEDGEFWAATRPEPESGKPAITLYTEELAQIKNIIKNFKSVYNATSPNKSLCICGRRV